jgi:hypothetical protein
MAGHKRRQPREWIHRRISGRRLRPARLCRMPDPGQTALRAYAFGPGPVLRALFHLADSVSGGHGRGGHQTGLWVWGGLAAVFFGYIEALVLCRHCPHYAETGKLLRCHANWGLPKIPRFDPRSLSTLEKGAWLAYVTVLFLFFLPFFIAGRQWVFLGLCVGATVVVAWRLQRHQCRRCYNLSCPVNRVPEAVRAEFFRNYPDFARAWRRENGPGDGNPETGA